tara:strand:- start:140 stop:514 length:375 start_codon:yes stop_codon:yes gene_type:complete
MNNLDDILPLKIRLKEINKQINTILEEKLRPMGDALFLRILKHYKDDKDVTGITMHVQGRYISCDHWAEMVCGHNGDIFDSNKTLYLHRDLEVAAKPLKNLLNKYAEEDFEMHFKESQFELKRK